MSQAEYDDFIRSGQKLAGRVGHSGPKRIIDLDFKGEFATNIDSLNRGLKPDKRYLYKVVIKGDGTLRDWLNTNARFGDDLTSTFGHPDTFEVPNVLLTEMQKHIMGFEVNKLK
jgi:hypothetical protein